MRKIVDKVLSHPNTLTLFRVITVPAIVILMMFPNRVCTFVAAILFSAAAITDYLDGYIARRQNLITSLGKFLDTLADKILVSVTLIMLLSLNRVPAWIVAIIIAREVAVTGLRIAASHEKLIIEASKLAKYKTTFQLSATAALLIHYTYFNINFHLVGMILLWIALVITVWSGIIYFIKFFSRAFTT